MDPNIDFVLISFDLDCINPAFFPGISLPAVIGGFTDDECKEMVQILASECQKIKVLDFSEYNPTVESRRSGIFLVFLLYFYVLEYFL
jgi:arginase family enzyme